MRRANERGNKYADGKRNKERKRKAEQILSQSEMKTCLLHPGSVTFRSPATPRRDTVP